MDTTHRVVIEDPQLKLSNMRITRFLVGCVVLSILWHNHDLILRWLYSFSDFQSPSSGGMGSVSVTAMVVTLAFEFVMAVGYLSILVFTFGWRVIQDIVNGIFTLTQRWRARTEAQRVAVDAAAEAALVAQANAAGATAGQTAAMNANATGPASQPPATPPTPVVPMDPIVFQQRVHATLRQQRDDIAAIGGQLTSISATLQVLANPPAKTNTRTRTTTKGKAS